MEQIETDYSMSDSVDLCAPVRGTDKHGCRKVTETSVVELCY